MSEKALKTDHDCHPRTDHKHTDQPKGSDVISGHVGTRMTIGHASVDVSLLLNKIL